MWHDDGPPPWDRGGGDDLPPDAESHHRREPTGRSAKRDGKHRRPTTPRPRWKKYLLRTAAGLGVVVLLAGGFVVYEYVHLSGNINHKSGVLAEDDPNIRDPEKQLHAANYLLIGSDTREGENGEFESEPGEVGGGRSDTTILAHLSPDHTKAIMVSFPRDALVTRPECTDEDGNVHPEVTEVQFNSAYAIGGPHCTVLAVQALTHIQINHYVEIDFNGFQNMVNAVGGVDVCSNQEIHDSYSGLNVVEGQNHLDGKGALALVRIRHNIPNTVHPDLERIQRQQRFLGVLARTATSSGTLLNPLKLTGFLDAVTGSLTVDDQTGLGDLKDLAQTLNNLGLDNLNFLTAPVANPAYNPNDPSDLEGSRVLLDEEAGQALYDSIIDDTDPPDTSTSSSPDPSDETTPPPETTITVPPTDVQVFVYNGVGTSGLAGQASTDLANAGFTIADVGDQNTSAQQTEIHYGDNLEGARTVAAAVPGSVLVQDSEYGAGVGVVVGANYDGVNPVSVGDPYEGPDASGGGTGGDTGGGTLGGGEDEGGGAGTEPSGTDGGGTDGGDVIPDGAVNGADDSCFF